MSSSLLGDGTEIIDLTWPLSATTPTIQLPPPKVSPPPFELHEISRYDPRGEHEYHNYFISPEHGGTHVDAPIHWFTGRDLDDISTVPLNRLIGPAVVIDASRAAAEDPDHLVTRADVERFIEEHGPLPERAWFLLNTGWGQHYADPVRFLNRGEDGRPHWPGLTTECAKWLARETDLLGIGVDTIGTDAGISSAFEPAHPTHHYFHEAGKCGMSSLANLGKLPPIGATVVAAPVRIEGGSAAPARVFALLPPKSPV